MSIYTQVAQWRVLLNRKLEEQEEQSTTAPPEAQQVRMHAGWDEERTTSNGVIYQRCGGGYRVIRKRLGGV